MLVAIRGEKPDRVPVCPDISNMIPCRLTGKTFEQIYLHHNPPLGQAYTEAVKYFGFDGWYQNWQPKIIYKNRHGIDPTITSEIQTLPEGRCKQTTLYETSIGNFSQQTLYYPADPPTITEKFIKNIKEDLPLILQWFDSDVTDIDWSGGQESYEDFGDLGIWGLVVGCPGLHTWTGLFNGGLEAAIEAVLDFPEMMDTLLKIEQRLYLDVAKRYINGPVKPDFLMIGASGLLSLSSPDLFCKYSLPTIKDITSLCRQAGMPTMLHACGKSKFLLETFVAETDLDCMNPLECPPMGDVELADAKKISRGKIALMGNLQTTDVMLRGSVEEVVRASRKAIEDAGEGGGFILSTGDQCGRDTPDENIRAMIRTAQEYGRY